MLHRGQELGEGGHLLSAKTVVGTNLSLKETKPISRL